ncbi:MAG: VWA domain-containing protein [Pyrinomonadaceae bacterium]
MTEPARRLLPIFLLLASFAICTVGQNREAKPSPSPTPTDEDQQRVRVFTEEVRLPVLALDAYGHFDPTLESDDVLVLEDGVAQQVRSVRRIPANVLLFVDTGGEFSGLGGMSKSTSLTRQIALNLVRLLPEGSWIEILQSGSSAEIIQPWTRDKQALIKSLNTKLAASKRSRFSEALSLAANELKSRPEGSRHLVMITDGVDSPGGKTDRSQAISKLMSARATVHIISYTELVQQKGDKKDSAVSAGQRSPASDPITATDPTLPPGTTRSPSFSVSIRFDPAMRRQRKAYETEVRKSEQVLANVADETGGWIILPISSDQMIAESTKVGRTIGSEYVVTYRPTRPLADARQGEYRRIEVSSRRVGLTLKSRRGYVVPSSRDN